MRILVVEDDIKTISYLRRGLTENGITVGVARDGESGLKAALAAAYDLIILDVMLPGRDGWSILKELRRAGKLTPVLFLSARDELSQRVKGLELGADDYLVKPFAFAELLARIRSICRRSAPGLRGTLLIADLELDLVRQRATRRGKHLDLTPKEFGLLSLLARNAGEVVSRAVMAREVWDMASVGDTNLVDVHVRRLRSKVDDPFEQKLIHTVRGAGYVLTARS